MGRLKGYVYVYDSQHKTHATAEDTKAFTSTHRTRDTQHKVHCTSAMLCRCCCLHGVRAQNTSSLRFQLRFVVPRDLHRLDLHLCRLVLQERDAAATIAHVAEDEVAMRHEQEDGRRPRRIQKTQTTRVSRCGRFWVHLESVLLGEEVVGGVAEADEEVCEGFGQVLAGVLEEMLG